MSRARSWSVSWWGDKTRSRGRIVEPPDGTFEYVRRTATANRARRTITVVITDQPGDTELTVRTRPTIRRLTRAGEARR